MDWAHVSLIFRRRLRCYRLIQALTHALSVFLDHSYHLYIFGELLGACLRLTLDSKLRRVILIGKLTRLQGTGTHLSPNIHLEASLSI